MKITTKMKRHAGKNWCKHTDNAYGGRNHKAVRIGKRVLRKGLKNMLDKLFKDEEKLQTPE